MPMEQPSKRRRILDAAVEIFSRYGFYNSKVAQVAKAAGVADGTIYLYFKNKEDILIQVFEDTMEEANSRQRMALDGLTSATEKLRTFVRVHFELVGRNPALAEVLTVELRQSSKFMRDADMRSFGRYLAIGARIVAEGQASGEFSPDLRPRRVARMLFGAIDELALEWAVSARSKSVEEAYSQTVRVFLNGLSRK
jgi:TetR/AcrR family fatty acid metabolism transcriptional regulator